MDDCSVPFRGGGRTVEVQHGGLGPDNQHAKALVEVVGKETANITEEEFMGDHDEEPLGRSKTNTEAAARQLKLLSSLIKEGSTPEAVALRVKPLSDSDEGCLIAEAAAQRVTLGRSETNTEAAARQLKLLSSLIKEGLTPEAVALRVKPLSDSNEGCPITGAAAQRVTLLSAFITGCYSKEGGSAQQESLSSVIREGMTLGLNALLQLTMLLKRFDDGVATRKKEEPFSRSETNAEAAAQQLKLLSSLIKEGLTPEAVARRSRPLSDSGGGRPISGAAAQWVTLLSAFIKGGDSEEGGSAQQGLLSSIMREVLTLELSALLQLRTAQRAMGLKRSLADGVAHLLQSKPTQGKGMVLELNALMQLKTTQRAMLLEHLLDDGVALALLQLKPAQGAMLLAHSLGGSVALDLQLKPTQERSTTVELNALLQLKTDQGVMLLEHSLDDGVALALIKLRTTQGAMLLEHSLDDGVALALLRLEPTQGAMLLEHLPDDGVAPGRSSDENLSSEVAAQQSEPPQLSLSDTRDGTCGGARSSEHPHDTVGLGASCGIQELLWACFKTWRLTALGSFKTWCLTAPGVSSPRRLIAPLGSRRAVDRGADSRHLDSALTPENPTLIDAVPLKNGRAASLAALLLTLASTAYFSRMLRYSSTLPPLVDLVKRTWYSGGSTGKWRRWAPRV
jgi:hypothetical protein